MCVKGSIFPFSRIDENSASLAGGITPSFGGATPSALAPISSPQAQWQNPVVVAQKMQALNDRFQLWVAEQLKSSNVVDLSPGLQDYLNHAKRVCQTTLAPTSNETVIPPTMPKPAFGGPVWDVMRPGVASASGQDEDAAADTDTEQLTKSANPDEERSSYSTRAKMFYQKDKNSGKQEQVEKEPVEKEWVERGKGDLNLVTENGKTRLVLRNDSANRLTLLNIYLFPEMKLNRQGKKDLMFFCIPNPPVTVQCAVCKVSQLLCRQRLDDCQAFIFPLSFYSFVFLMSSLIFFFCRRTILTHSSRPTARTIAIVHPAAR